MMNLWGDNKNRRQMLTLFCCFLALLTGFLIFVPVAKSNWTEIVEFVKVKIFRVDKSSTELDIPSTDDETNEQEQPENPGEPEDPSEPVNPDEPGIPENPEEPNEPEVPDEPEPGDPEPPEQPDEPDQPNDPEDPRPEEPEAPTPEQPDEPVDPGMPDEPTDPPVNPNPPVEPEPEDPAPEEPALTPEEIAFNDMVERLQKLEDLAMEYYSNNETKAREEFIKYLRAKRYNDSSWDLLAGSPDSAFNSYVLANQGEYNLSSFSDFKIPATGETVDFYHLFAVMDVEFSQSANYAYTGGWGGDLLQLMQQYKGTSLTGQALIDSVSNAFNNSSSFGRSDVCADFDAVNIVQMYKNSTGMSMTECLTSYYNTITTEKRIEGFKANEFSNNCTETEVLSILSSYTNITMLALRLKLGVTISSSNEVCMACIKVFVAYVNQTSL